jgi:hypothetical protein
MVVNPQVHREGHTLAPPLGDHRRPVGLAHWPTTGRSARPECKVEERVYGSL